MQADDTKIKDFWDYFEEWEKEWEETRKKERLEEAIKLREAEEDYETSQKLLNPLKKPIKTPKELLGVKSSEPATGVLPLTDPDTLPLIIPVTILKTESIDPVRLCIYIKSKMDQDLFEILKFFSLQIKRLVEYILNERILFVLETDEKGSYYIKIGWDNEQPPFFEILYLNKEAIIIHALQESIEWVPGYYFDCKEILEKIAQRLSKEIVHSDDSG